MALEECYARTPEQIRVDGQIVEIVKWNKIMAGMVTNVNYGFIYMETMPQGWEPSENDVMYGDLPGTENAYDVPGYMKTIDTTRVNGQIVSTLIEYYSGLISRETTVFFQIIGSDEYMPEGWSPVSGVHKILWEDVYDTNE
ncbi:hypothetical protein [Dolichospermum phage Dfl-JY23]